MAARTRALAALTLAAMMILGAVVPALAWESQVEGLPGPIRDAMAYLIGHNANGWHLRTHGPRRQHFFTGLLTTDGRFYDVELRNPERLDSVYVADGGRTLRLSFRTGDYADGVDFRVDGGTYVAFSLDVDGRPIAPQHIYLGAAGQHPESNPFAIWR
jgi:hypothetical protein